MHGEGNWSKICKKAETKKEGTKMVGSLCLGYRVNIFSCMLGVKQI